MKNFEKFVGPVIILGLIIFVIVPVFFALGDQAIHNQRLHLSCETFSHPYKSMIRDDKCYRATEYGWEEIKFRRSK